MDASDVLDKRVILILKSNMFFPPQTEYGDVIDCIDIYKQYAFDHPMLKNHTIQVIDLLYFHFFFFSFFFQS